MVCGVNYSLTFINIILSEILSPEWVLRFIIFFSSFTTTFIVLRNVILRDYFIVLLFLILPLVLKNNIIHLRQGAAIAFFLCGWFSQQKKIKYSLFLCAALVHSSFMIVLFCVLIVNILLYLKLSYGVRNVLYIIFSLLIGTSALLIANFLGARQGAGYKESADVSGLSFIFWGGVTGFFIIQGREFLFRYAYAVFFLLLYLSTYFLIPVTARVFESVILLVLLSIIDFKGQYKYLGIIYFLMYFFALWVMRIDEPGFGWLA